MFLSTSNHQYFDPTLLALKERDFGVIGFSGTEIPQSAEYIAGQLHKAWENSLVNNIEKQWRVNWNPDVPIQLTIPPSELTQYLFEEGRSHAKI